MFYTVDDEHTNTGSIEEQIDYTHTLKLPIAKNLLQSNKIINGVDSDLVTARYKLLRTQVLQRMKENDSNTLAISSPGYGEGKTLTAINLSITIAREVNHTVLLVDFDLRRPMIHKYFGFEPHYDLSDHLHTGIPLQKLFVNPGIERLVILPGKRSFQNSSELLSSDRMSILVDELRTRYQTRLIIFDLPPLLEMDDVLAFSLWVKSFLLVVQEGKTKISSLEKSKILLEKCHIVGTVINRASDLS